MWVLIALNQRELVVPYHALLWWACNCEKLQIGRFISANWVYDRLRVAVVSSNTFCSWIFGASSIVSSNKKRERNKISVGKIYILPDTKMLLTVDLVLSTVVLVVECAMVNLYWLNDIITPLFLDMRVCVRNSPRSKKYSARVSLFAFFLFFFSSVKYICILVMTRRLHRGFCNVWVSVGCTTPCLLRIFLAFGYLMKKGEEENRSIAKPKADNS